MSRGPGKRQRAVLAVLENSHVGGYVMPLRPQAIAGEIWDAPTRSQVGSVRRALDGLEIAGLVTRGRRSPEGQLWELSRQRHEPGG